MIHLSLKGKLGRYKHHLTLENNAHDEPQPVREEVKTNTDIPYLTQWKRLQARPYYFDGEYAMVREVHLPLHDRHGRYTYAQLLEMMEEWKRNQPPHPLSAERYEPSDLLFFDTETTGLGSGTGNTIFLLGSCRISENGVQIKQWILPAPASEVAMYHGFLNDTEDSDSLVTYNGKAFDWPQLKTRHTLIRNRLPQLPAFGHFDLLHAARRLWKNTLPSCRLSVVEEHILYFKREHDVPGHMVPILYFDFLREKDPTLLEGVFRHNEWDVCSLASLYVHISGLLLETRNPSLSDQEALQIGRWHEQLGNLAQAVHFYKKAAKGETDVEAKHAMALIYKKWGERDEALAIWERLRHQTTLFTDIHIELAKIYEHHMKDYEKARRYTLHAYDHWRERQRIVRKRQEKQAFLKRIERLEKKMSHSISHFPNMNDL